MIKIKKLFIYLLVATTPLAAQAITLEEALINAYKTNPELNAQRESLKASDEAIMKALSRWLPTARVQASKTYLKQETQAGVRSSGDGKSHSLTITQNLFRSGADMARIKAAHSTINSARAKLDSKEQEVFLKAVQAYMNALASKEVYQIAQIREKDNAKLLIGTTQRFKAGDVSKTDVALAEAELASAKAERAVAQSNYETAKANFKAIIGLRVQNLTLPKNNLILPKTVDETVNTAIIKNPQIVDVKNTADASKQNIGITRAFVLPSVDLEHQISDNTRNELSGIRKNHTTSIVLNIPIFGSVTSSGDNAWSSLREQKRLAAQAQNSMHFTIKSVRASAVETWVKFQADKKSLKARESEYKARKIAYDGAKAQEKAGLMSTLDIVSYQREYFRTYAQFISARSTYYTSLYSLKSIVGECTAQGLKLNTEYYDPLKNYNSIKWQLIGAF